MPSASAKAPAEATRAALIAAGYRCFGSKGFDATSTRELAALANTNLASISYHFGGKNGLRLACGEAFAEQLSKALAGPSLAIPETAAAARQELHAVLRRMAQFLLGRAGAADLAAFLLREITSNSPVIDHIYPSFMEPAHRRLCLLWGKASGMQAESDIVRLRVFSLVGQILYFRIGQPIVARRMGWGEAGASEVQQITDMLIENLDALLDASRKE